MAGREQRGDGERDRVGGDFIQAREVALAHLLPAGGLGQAHHLHPHRVVELGEGRVVESEMSIFAIAQRAEVSGMVAQQGRIVRAVLLQPARPGPHRVEALHRDVVEEVAMEEGGEAGGVALGQGHVLVHVEDGDPPPFHVHPPQGLQEGELGVAGGDNDVGLAAIGDGPSQDIGRGPGRGLAHGLVAGVHSHGQGFDLGGEKKIGQEFAPVLKIRW